MIQANELRIGNLLHWSTNNEIVVVDSEHIRMCSVSQNDFNRLYKPIPITEESLLKFGFVTLYKSQFTWKFELKDHPSIEVYLLPTVAFYIRGQHLTDFKYIHEIQNAVFALIQKELEYDTSK
jgi:hypothetical protein